MSAFDELHRAFNARIPVNSQEHVEVVRHDHEIVQLELASQGIGPKHINKKLGFILCLEEWSIHIGLTSGEKRPLSRDDITPVGFSCELYHAAAKAGILLRLLRPG